MLNAFGVTSRLSKVDERNRRSDLKTTLSKKSCFAPNLGNLQVEDRGGRPPLTIHPIAVGLKTITSREYR